MNAGKGAPPSSSTKSYNLPATLSDMTSISEASTWNGQDDGPIGRWASMLRYKTGAKLRFTLAHLLQGMKLNERKSRQAQVKFFLSQLPPAVKGHLTANAWDQERASTLVDGFVSPTKSLYNQWGVLMDYFTPDPATLKDFILHLPDPYDEVLEEAGWSPKRITSFLDYQEQIPPKHEIMGVRSLYDPIHNTILPPPVAVWMGAVYHLLGYLHGCPFVEKFDEYFKEQKKPLQWNKLMKNGVLASTYVKFCDLVYDFLKDAAFSVTFYTFEKSGWINRQSDVMKSWKKEYLVLRDVKIYFFDVAIDPAVKDLTAQKPKIILKIKGGRVAERPDVGKPYAFTVSGTDDVTGKPREVLVHSNTEEEQQEWISLMRGAIMHFTDQTLSDEVVAHFASIMAAESGTEHLMDTRNLGKPMFLKTGFLEKRGHVVKNWKLRWFVLHDEGIWYHASEKEKAKGYIPLEGSWLERVSNPVEQFNKHFAIVIHTSLNRDYYLSASNDDDMEDWYSAIKQAIRYFNMQTHALFDVVPELIEKYIKTLQPKGKI